MLVARMIEDRQVETYHLWPHESHSIELSGTDPETDDHADPADIPIKMHRHVWLLFPKIYFYKDEDISIFSHMKLKVDRLTPNYKYYECRYAY